MKKKTKTGTARVYLKPIALRMIDHVCKVEGLTREEVLETLLHCILADEEAKR